MQRHEQLGSDPVAPPFDLVRGDGGRFGIGKRTLTTLAHEKVTFAQSAALTILVAEIHQRQIDRVHTVPLDIDVSQVRGEIRSNDALLIEHLPKLH